MIHLSCQILVYIIFTNINITLLEVINYILDASWSQVNFDLIYNLLFHKSLLEMNGSPSNEF